MTDIACDCKGPCEHDMPSKKPFKNCFATNTDLSWVGLSHALLQWLQRDRGPFPNVLWITKEDEEVAPKVLDLVQQEYSKEYRDRIRVKIAEDYPPGQWSIGSDDDYGFGSIGA